MTMRLCAEPKQFKVDPFSIGWRTTGSMLRTVRITERRTDGTIGEITRDITIEGDVPEDQRARLMEIAGKCPVRQTLTHEIKIRSDLLS
jgi:uncharacterized OsmC-like protein